MLQQGRGCSRRYNPVCSNRDWYQELDPSPNVVTGAVAAETLQPTLLEECTGRPIGFSTFSSCLLPAVTGC